ncbi:MAG: GYD domain-containing protein [Hyphomicrobiales bacterium]|nr:GYD domain-containing protein [Hyphomicrobiales bacterium]
MPKYLFQVRYSSVGAGGVAREGGVGRRAAAKTHLEAVGGKLESMHFAFGEVDCFLIADLPDNASAAAFSLAANESGAMTTSTIVLMTPEEVDNAVAKKVDFRAPGR